MICWNNSAYSLGYCGGLCEILFFFFLVFWKHHKAWMNVLTPDPWPRRFDYICGANFSQKQKHCWYLILRLGFPLEYLLFVFDTEKYEELSAEFCSPGICEQRGRLWLAPTNMDKGSVVGCLSQAKPILCHGKLVMACRTCHMPFTNFSFRGLKLSLGEGGFCSLVAERLMLAISAASGTTGMEAFFEMQSIITADGTKRRRFNKLSKELDFQCSIWRIILTGVQFLKKLCWEEMSPEEMVQWGCCRLCRVWYRATHRRRTHGCTATRTATTIIGEWKCRPAATAANIVRNTECGQCASPAHRGPVSCGCSNPAKESSVRILFVLEFPLRICLLGCAAGIVFTSTFWSHPSCYGVLSEDASAACAKAQLSITFCWTKFLRIEGDF